MNRTASFRLQTHGTGSAEVHAASADTDAEAGCPVSHPLKLTPAQPTRAADTQPVEHRARTTSSADPVPIHPQSAAAAPGAASRRYDLDWLRVGAVFLLLLFHSGMPFIAEWGWHIKNAETSNLFLEWMFWLHGWRMALLFLISGIGTVLALGHRSSGQYLAERAKRLLIPLLFGMLVIVPPQVYMERIAAGVHFDGYLDFYRSVFQLVPYPRGNTSWHHLWFVLYLFCYSLLLLPLALKLRDPAVRARLTASVAGWKLYALALPLGLARLLLYRFPETHDLVHDPAIFLYYALIFSYGLLFGTDARVWQVIEAQRRSSLRFAFFALVAVDYVRWNGIEGSLSLSGLMAVTVLNTFGAWCWVLTALGYGKRFLNRDNALRRYATEAVYPFYILHQSVIVVLAYYVVQVKHESILNKWLFLTSVSFALTMGLYEFLIRPYPLMRRLFGLHPHPAAIAVARPDVALPNAATTRSSAAAACAA